MPIVIRRVDVKFSFVNPFRCVDSLCRFTYLCHW